MYPSPDYIKNIFTRRAINCGSQDSSAGVVN